MELVRSKGCSTRETRRGVWNDDITELDFDALFGGVSRVRAGDEYASA